MYSPKKNKNFIKNLLIQQEGLHLDFKQGLSNKKKIAKTLLAFANTDGGMVVVGVSDDGRSIGIDPEEEMFMINEAILQFCQPSLEVLFEVYEMEDMDDMTLQNNEKYLLIVHVPKSSIAPHFLIDGPNEPILYLRSNDQSIPSNSMPIG